MINKICPRCSTYKLISEFSKNKLDGNRNKLNRII